MKAIQYFRYKNHLSKERNIRETMIASLLLNYASLKGRFENIELWIDIEGRELLEQFPISWSSVRLLRSDQSDNNIDHLKIAAMQSEPFLFFEEGALVLNDLPTDRMHHELIVYSLTKDPGNEYVHEMDIQSLLDDQDDFPEWRNEPGLSTEIFGGTNPALWKSYSEFVSNFLAANPRVRSLSRNAFRYLVQSRLLKKFANQNHISIKVIDDDPKRMHQVRSTSNLLRFHQQSMVIVMPDSLIGFADIQRFIKALLQAKDHRLWKSFITQFPGNDKPLPVVSDIPLDAERTIDSVHYEALKKDLSDKLRSTKTRDTGIRILTLSDFRNNIDLIAVKSPLTAISKTKWDWRLGVDVKEVRDLKRVANSVTSPSEYTTLLNERPGTGYITETNIDDLNEIILQCFEIPVSITAGVEKVKEYFDEADQANNGESLFYSITLRVYDLYRLGALNVIDQQ